MARAEYELWEALLQADGVQCHWQPDTPLTEDVVTVADDPQATIPYPWNPMVPEAEPFLNQMAAAVEMLDGWNPDAIQQRASDFFAIADAAWTTTPLQAQLYEKFADRVPTTQLRAIAQQAQQLLDATSALADRLVQCASAALPQLTELAEDDLYVLARPLAYAMRDGDAKAIESTLSAVRLLDWQELSEIERARLSLAVARYALVEADTDNLK